MQALNSTQTVELSTGESILVQELFLDDWTEALTRYARLLETLALMSDYENSNELTDEFVEENMPLIIGQIYSSGGLELVLEFFSYCVPNIRELKLRLSDVTNIWLAMYAVNRDPFVGKRKEMLKLGTFDLIKTVDVGSLISFVSSIAPALASQNSEGAGSQLITLLESLQPEQDTKSD